MSGRTLTGRQALLGRRTPVMSMLLASALLGAGSGAAPLAGAAAAALRPAAVGVTHVPLAADPPFATDGSSSGGDDRAAGATASTARLDRLAAVLRREPLAVDPEVDWIFDVAQHRALERALRGTRVPVLVAALPMLDEDESGGDSQRILRTLQQRVGRKALYVVVDQDGRMDLASVGVPLDLSIPYSLMQPTRDERSYEEQARDPGPRSWESVPGRLRGVLAAVAKAGPGPPNGVVDDVTPLEELDHDYAGDRLREDTIFLSIVGATLGAGAAAVILVVLRAARRRGAAAADGAAARPGGSGPPGGSAHPGESARPGGRPGRGRRGRRSRRGRRRGGPRA